MVGCVVEVKNNVMDVVCRDFKTLVQIVWVSELGEMVDCVEGVNSGIDTVC